MPTIKKKKEHKAEKVIYKLCFVLAVFIVVGTIFSQTKLSEVNLQVEKLKIELNTQKDTNQSLTMKINEMASLENIQTIAKSLGLAYNNDNVKTIE